jgi:hypothetical protein
MMNLVSDSSLVTLIEANEISILEKQIKKNLNELPNGPKLKAASELYTENQLLKNLGEVANDIIERMDEQIENMDKNLYIILKICLSVCLCDHPFSQPSDIIQTRDRCH